MLTVALCPAKVCPLWSNDFQPAAKENPLKVRLHKAVLPPPPTGPGRSRQTVFRNQPSVARAARVDRTTYPLRASNARTNRRTPLQSSGPRQAQGASTRTRLLETRRQHNTKPQSDQRNPNTHILSKWKRFTPEQMSLFHAHWRGAEEINFVCTMFSVHSVNPGRAWYPFLFIASESVHVVSLQALKTPGQNTLGKTAVTTKTTPGTFSFMKDLHLHGQVSFISHQPVKM